jgi:hypothetical protein
MYPPNPKDDLEAADAVEDPASDNASDDEAAADLEEKSPIYVYEGTFLIKD